MLIHNTNIYREWPEPLRYYGVDGLCKECGKITPVDADHILRNHGVVYPNKKEIGFYCSGSGSTNYKPL